MNKSLFAACKHNLVIKTVDINRPGLLDEQAKLKQSLIPSGLSKSQEDRKINLQLFVCLYHKKDFSEPAGKPLQKEKNLLVPRRKIMFFFLSKIHFRYLVFFLYPGQYV
jgi:hypothetical protein